MSEPEYHPEQHLARATNELELSVRTCNLLDKLSIRTIGELVGHTPQALLDAGADQRSINELKEILADLGLALHSMD